MSLLICSYSVAGCTVCSEDLAGVHDEAGKFIPTVSGRIKSMCVTPELIFGVVGRQTAADCMMHVVKGLASLSFDRLAGVIPKIARELVDCAGNDARLSMILTGWDAEKNKIRAVGWDIWDSEKDDGPVETEAAEAGSGRPNLMILGCGEEAHDFAQRLMRQYPKKTPDCFREVFAKMADMFPEIGRVLTLNTVTRAGGRARKPECIAAEGSTYKRLAHVDADNTLHVSTSLNAQASILPSQVLLINYQMPDANTLIASWPAQSIARPDTSSLSVPASAGANILTNGDMESGTVGSQETGWTNLSGFGLTTVNTNVHSGSKAGNINNTSAQTSLNYIGGINLTGGQVYVIEGWIKTDALPNVPTHDGGMLYVSTASGITSYTIITKFGAFDNGKTTVPVIGLPANGVAHAYTFLQCYFIPTASGVVNILCGNQSNGGNCWFDDVKLYLHNGQAYRSLTASGGYYLYSYVESLTGAVKFANGTPPPTSPSDSLAQQCSIDLRINVPVKHITMPTVGGSGSDTGGGSGTCSEFDGPAFIQRYSNEGELLFEGEIKAGEVCLGYESDDGLTKRGDLLKGYSFAQQKDVYRAVQHRMHVPCAGWIKLDGIRFTACEGIYDPEKQTWTPAWKVPGAEQDSSVGIKVMLQVEADWDDEHNYYIGKRLIHNGVVLPC